MPTFTELMQQATSLEEARRAGAYIQAERQRRLALARQQAKPTPPTPYLPLIQKGMPPTPAPDEWQPTTTPYYQPALGQQLQTGRPPGAGIAPMVALPLGYQRAEDGSLVPETFWDTMLEPPPGYHRTEDGSLAPTFWNVSQYLPYVYKGMPRPLPQQEQEYGDVTTTIEQTLKSEPVAGLSVPILREVATKPEGKAFLGRLLNSGLFTKQAKDYLEKEIKVEFGTWPLLEYSYGYGGWAPGAKLIGLQTTEAWVAIHELAHAWWETQRANERKGLVRALLRFAEDGPAQRQYPRAAHLAHIYIEDKIEPPGEPATLINGEWWNDWEIYAGFAGELRGDIRLLPPYIKKFYKDFLMELPTKNPGSLYPTPTSTNGHINDLFAQATARARNSWGTRPRA